jgi:hypothetical protein
LVYYSIAIAYLPSMIKLLFKSNIPNETRSEHVGAVLPPTVVLSILFLLGASVPIAERLIPSRDFSSYTEAAKTVLNQEGSLSEQEIETFLQEDQAVLLTGIALYPRYIQPNSRFKPLGGSSIDRYLHLWLLNEEDSQIVLPIQNIPKDLPHRATISVIGCREEDYISAFAIIVHEPANQLLQGSPAEMPSCRQVEP